MKKLLLCVLALSGCSMLHVAGNARKPLAIEQVLTWNAALAESNLSLAKAVIAANDAGDISLALSNAILTEQSRIADANRQLTPVLGKSCTPQQQIAACNPSVLSGDSATISGYLTQISASGAALVKDGTAGIKNPERAKAVQSAIDGINTLAGQMLAGLKTLGVLK